MSSLAQTQRDFAAHLRDPEHVAGPPGIEARRLKIYRDLVFNNVEGFVRGGFPVLFSLISAADWRVLVRAFLVEHRARTPYFLEISQEFLQFLRHRAGAFAFLPPFTLELAHYEWVELALDVAPEGVPEEGIDRRGDLLIARPIVNPLVWVMAYQYPVHRIRRDFQPVEPLQQPVYLAVYRNRHDRVRFLELNATTARLLQLLKEPDAGTGGGVLEQLASELPQVARNVVLQNGAKTLLELLEREILLGTVPA